MTTVAVLALLVAVAHRLRLTRPLSRAVAPTPCRVPARVRLRCRGSAARRASIESAMPDAIELVVLAVRAGAVPSVAVTSVIAYLAATIRPAFMAVQQSMVEGTRFADAVELLPRMLGPPATALADSLAAADRDGLPLAPVLDRLAVEARQQRRRRADVLARQLPVRLSLPLVLCTLPSFVLLAVAPLLLAALSSLHH